MSARDELASTIRMNDVDAMDADGLADAIIAALPELGYVHRDEIRVKPLEWGWIGDTHAYGRGCGHSYEILKVKPSAQLTVSNPPDLQKLWRGKSLGYAKGKFLGHEWHESKEAAMNAREEEHAAQVLAALDIQERNDG